MLGIAPVCAFICYKILKKHLYSVMIKPYVHFIIAIISLLLAALSVYALMCLGTGNVIDFILLLIVCIDAIFFPWAFCYHIYLHLNGKRSFLDKFPFHSGYVLFFFISPYFAFLYIDKCVKR